MPTRGDLLREKTHKGDVEDLAVRVFYTLTDDKAVQTHRNSKAIALLVDHLHEKNLIPDEEIDELLLRVLDLAE